MNFSDVKSLSNQYLMSTYNKFDISIEKGKDCTLYDINEKEYIDLTSGIGVNCLGHSNPIIVDAVKNQAQKLLHMSNLYYNENQAVLAEKLVKASNMKRVFFCNSGAEANEGAIKIARKYSTDKYKKDRTDIISLKMSFHGRTITTLSATGQDAMHEYFHPFTQGFVYSKANDIDDIKSKITDKTCAVMIELIQGEGGVVVLEKDFVKELYELCSQKDILLIADEVQTGIARTAKMFCFEHYDIIPDIVTLAKGLGGGFPIGAVLCSQKTENTLTASTHGTTFGGNPMACAVASAVVDEVCKKEFLEEVEKKGQYLKEKLSKVKNVINVRGKGLMIGFDVNNMKAIDVLNKCIENNLLILTAKNSLRLLPPLVISYSNIDKAVCILDKVINN